MTDQNVVDVLSDIDQWRSGKLWGKSSIAKFAGVSIDKVARWATLPGCPITRPGGAYFVTRGALTAWLTSKTNENQR